MAKAILKADFNVYDAAEETVSEAKERLMDFIAEVRKEMNGRATSKNLFAQKDLTSGDDLEKVVLKAMATIPVRVKHGPNETLSTQSPPA